MNAVWRSVRADRCSAVREKNISQALMLLCSSICTVFDAECLIYKACKHMEMM